MQRSILQSANVKLALLYAALFSISVLILVAFLFYTVREHVEGQARAHIEAETSQLIGDYRDDGMDELRHDIRERVEDSTGHRLIYRVEGPAGRSIFDKLSNVPHNDGWQRFTLEDGTPIVAHIHTIDDGYRLIVAADMSLVRELEDAMRNRLLVMLGFLLLVAVGGGVWVSRRFLARVDRLSRTTVAIGEGQLSARVPLTGTGDDFDQLSMTINRMLERIEHLVGDVRHVSTAIAHDLRTPLTHLRQKLEQLASTDQSPAARALTDEAIAELEAALATFTALLRIAEIESGSRRAGFGEVPFSALVRQMGEVYGPVASAQDVTLQTTIDDGIYVQGDRDLLTQCIANLIENALRHSGGDRIELTLTSLEGRAMLSVIDNGRGIDPAHHAEVLKPFTRLDASRTTAGNGLGLNLVRAIAELHHAELQLADHGPGLVVALRFP